MEKEVLLRIKVTNPGAWDVIEGMWKRGDRDAARRYAKMVSKKGYAKAPQARCARVVEPRSDKRDPVKLIRLRSEHKRPPAPMRLKVWQYIVTVTETGQGATLREAAALLGEEHLGVAKVAFTQFERWGWLEGKRGTEDGRVKIYFAKFATLPGTYPTGLVGHALPIGVAA